MELNAFIIAFIILSREKRSVEPSRLVMVNVFVSILYVDTLLLLSINWLAALRLVPFVPLTDE